MRRLLSDAFASLREPLYRAWELARNRARFITRCLAYNPVENVCPAVSIAPVSRKGWLVVLTYISATHRHFFTTERACNCIMKKTIFRVDGAVTSHIPLGSDNPILCFF